MARFYKYETVDIPITLSPDGVLEDYKHIVISIKQHGVQIDKTEDDIGIDTEQNLINVHLSQEETAMFQVGNAKIQLNIYYTNTERDTSTMADIEVSENLYKKVMTDE